MADSLNGIIGLEIIEADEAVPLDVVETVTGHRDPREPRRERDDCLSVASEPSR